MRFNGFMLNKLDNYITHQGFLESFDKLAVDQIDYNPSEFDSRRRNFFSFIFKDENLLISDGVSRLFNLM